MTPAGLTGERASYFQIKLGIQWPNWPNADSERGQERGAHPDAPAGHRVGV